MKPSWRREDDPADAQARIDHANSASLVRAALAQGVADSRVLEAMRTVRRASFVPRELRREVGSDYAIPIGMAQTTSQPSLIAMMIEALELGPEDTVLEIGTGFGYQAALLSRLARRVFSVERIHELAEVARRNLESEGCLNVTVVIGDGTLGLPEAAPFDAIVVAAAFVRVPAPLADQLVPGGRLVMPVGNGGGDLVKVFERQDGELLEKTVLCGARFVPLLGANGFESP